MPENNLKIQLEHLRIQVLILSDIAAAQVQLIRSNITTSFNELEDIQTQA